ncbi:DUF4350 domain-containing protein [Stenotrophomonas sp. MYb238]|uniref:DUF4350 domain-containing protein n=1 Tax=Stenotrophomonas sp. MYb238 TaxID=2040281 RepID=UPI0012922E5B|nr:DUF4350 domain-containing protein [Stenotrophomonas sp. MYb238]MQP76347.1 DUF4350 domain-containing protein [Stenotrophomonas sp. MYb238]
MSPRWRNALIALAVLLLAGVAVMWFLRSYQRVCEQATLPAYGEPSFNPLFALRETLRRDGVDAETRRTLDLPAMRLQPRDTVLLLDDPRQLAPAQVEQLVGWVEYGGHLLLRMPTPDETLDDERTLLDRFGIVPGEVAPRCQPWRVQGQEEHQEFCAGNRFTLGEDVRAERRWGDASDDTLAYARLRYGSGRVDVLADMDFLRNGQDEKDTGLRDLPHRDLARLVLAPNYGKGRMHLVYAAEAPSLWRTVLQRGWPIWLPLLLALLAWLWMRAQRFGPLLPSPRQERRSLLEHVRASGEHLHRYGKSPLLYDAVRQSFLARLRRRAPLAAALTGDAQLHAIADHLRWPPERVRLALQVPPSRDDAALRERIALLIQMRNQL